MGVDKTPNIRVSSTPLYKSEAEFGRQIKPRQFEAKSERGRYLSAILVRRKQVEEMLKAEKTPEDSSASRHALLD